MSQDDDRLAAIVSRRKALLKQQVEDDRAKEEQEKSDKDERDQQVALWTKAVLKIDRSIENVNSVLQQADIELRFKHEGESTSKGPVGYGEFSALVQNVPSRMSLRLTAMPDGTITSAYAPGPHPKDAPDLRIDGQLSQFDTKRWKTLIVAFAEFAVEGGKT